jgi:hypothetical protein
MAPLRRARAGPVAPGRVVPALPRLPPRGGRRGRRRKSGRLSAGLRRRRQGAVRKERMYGHRLSLHLGQQAALAWRKEQSRNLGSLGQPTLQALPERPRARRAAPWLSAHQEAGTSAPHPSPRCKGAARDWRSDAIGGCARGWPQSGAGSLRQGPGAGTGTLRRRRRGRVGRYGPAGGAGSGQAAGRRDRRPRRRADPAAAPVAFRRHAAGRADRRGAGASRAAEMRSEIYGAIQGVLDDHEPSCSRRTTRTRCRRGRHG